MEKLVSELFASKDITKVQSYILQSYTVTQLSPQGVVTVLWEYFTLALPSSDPEKSRNAIQVLVVLVLLVGFVSGVLLLDRQLKLFGKCC